MSELNDKPITGEDLPRSHGRTAPSAAVCAASSCAIFRSPLRASLVFLVVLAVGLYFVASSSAFENVVRKRLIASTRRTHRRPGRDCIFPLASAPF